MISVKFKMWLIVVGVVLTLLITIAGLSWALQAQIEKTATLKAEKQAVVAVNVEQMETIDRLRQEYRQLEQALTVRADRQAEIERESKAREAALKAEIYDLRKQYESVEEYLTAPVPDEFIDWLQRPRGADKN